jgi:hypothetical protein
VRCLKPGGDDDAAELGGHVGGGGFCLAGVPRGERSAIVQVGGIMACGGVPGDGGGLAGDLERDGALDGCGATRQDTLHARHDLAWTIGRQGGWAAAEQQFRDVLRLRRERRQRQGHQEDDADIMHTRCMMYWCIGKQGRWAEAEHDYRQLTADRAALLGSAHADTPDTRENIGKCLAWQGKWAQAADEWDRLAALRTTALGATNPDTLRTRQLAAYATGLLARQSGNRASRRRAATDLREILRVQVDVRGEDHQGTRETRALLTDLDDTTRPRSTWPEDLPQPRPATHQAPKHSAWPPQAFDP